MDFNDMGAPAEEMETMPPAEGEEGMMPEAEEGSDINEELASFQPKDILQYLIDNNLVAPETTLIEAEGEAGAAPAAGGEAPPLDFSAMLGEM